jgi:hypothetical protein
VRDCPRRRQDVGAPIVVDEACSCESSISCGSAAVGSLAADAAEATTATITTTTLASKPSLR